MTHITTEVSEAVLARLAYNIGVEDISMLGGEEINGPQCWMVFLNGKQTSKKRTQEKVGGKSQNESVGKSLINVQNNVNFEGSLRDHSLR